MALSRGYELWQIRDFSQGQVEKINNNMLPDNATPDAVNFISTKYGGIRKRNGFVQDGINYPGYIQTLHPYYNRETGKNTYIVIAHGEIYFKDDEKAEKLISVGTGTVNTTEKGANEYSLVEQISGDPFQIHWTGYIEINEEYYEILEVFVDEDDNDKVKIKVVEDTGTHTGLDYIYNQGIRVAIPTPFYPLKGTFLFGESLFNEPYPGEEMYNVPHDLALNVAKPVYIEEMVNFIIGMNGVNKPWKFDGSTFTILNNAPEKGNYPILHKEKLFCVDMDEPSTLVWSESFQPEQWTPINYWDIRKGDGDNITCLIRYLDDLFIFKQRSLSILKGTFMDDFSLQETSIRIGCVGFRAAVVHNLSVYFISEQGLFQTDGMKMVNLSDNIIPDTWKRLSKKYAHRSVITVWKDKLWLSIPVDGSATNNLVLIYDPNTSGFFVMEGIAASCYMHFDSGNGVELYGGYSTEGKVLIFDKGQTDNGELINAYWKGKYFDLGVPGLEKKSIKMFLQVSPETENKPDILVSNDYKAYDPLRYYRDKETYSEYEYENEQNRWYLTSPMLVHNKSGECEIREVAIPYKTTLTMRVNE